MNKLINIGYENSVNIDKVITIMNYGSLTAKRMLKKAKEKELLIDATEGNKTLSILITDSGNVIKSAVKAETLRKRCEKINK